MQEIWKNTEYQNIMISNFGDCYNTKTDRYIGHENMINCYKEISVKLNGKQHQVYPHRLVATAFIDNPNNKPFVDHIDGNGLNNNVSNLRWATKQENDRNRKLSKHNKLGIKGVSHRKSGKYRARIKVNGVEIYLGTYELLEDAIKARQKASQELFKEFQHTCDQRD
ncbi:MAG: hypothetical protein EOO89_01875 [Pedobacter sp.]|nr:MAG: hypothetical protein EOO89_01875 [Pedobacter sp.]